MSGPRDDPKDMMAALCADARSRLADVAVRTPVVRCSALDELAGCQVWLKAEGLQLTGSFKFRGAYNAAMVAAERGARAVVGYSSGNHAAALACAGRLLGLRVAVLMPSDAPSAKVEAARAYGAVIYSYDRLADDREEMARHLADSCQAEVIPSADSPYVIAGASTVTSELLDDAGVLDAVVVPIGGGGLLAGAVSVLPSNIRAIAAEPAASDDFSRSLGAGRRVSVDIGRTEADGLRLAAIAPFAWELVRNRATAVVVREGEIAGALRFMVDRVKLVAEPSGVAGLAAVLAGSVPELEGRRVGIVLSGANVDAGRLTGLLGAG